MNRKNKIIQDYQEKLKNNGIDNIPEFVQSILDADITKGKYSRFLLICYLNNKFREEDLKGGLDSTIGQAISLFHKYKDKVPEDMRSVYKYDSPGSLWNTVKQFEQQMTKQEIKKTEKDIIYEQTEFLYKNDINKFKVISPLTEEAAKWWGRGTRWCTSAEKNNMFYRYVKDAPLLILLMPGGEKLQLWKHNDDIQFMDEADNQITLEYIEKNWSVLEPVIMWLKDIRIIPKKNITKEICDIIVQNNPLSLQNIPLIYKTEEMCKIAFLRNKNVLQFIPEEYRANKFYKEEIKNDGLLLQYFKPYLITKKLSRLAVQQNGLSLSYIPFYLRTKKICKIAIRQNGMAILSVPENLTTKKMYINAILSNGAALDYIPKNMKTKKIYKFALKSNTNALKCIPEHMKTRKIYKFALKHSGEVLEYVSEEFKTMKMCKIAVRQNGLALQFVPKELRTIKLCQIALQQNKDALQFVPEKILKNFKNTEKLETQIINDNIDNIDNRKQIFDEIRHYLNNIN